MPAFVYTGGARDDTTRMDLGGIWFEENRPKNVTHPDKIIESKIIAALRKNRFFAEVDDANFVEVPLPPLPKLKAKPAATAHASATFGDTVSTFNDPGEMT